jgi:hypothetical protein
MGWRSFGARVFSMNTLLGMMLVQNAYAANVMDIYALFQPFSMLPA